MRFAFVLSMLLLVSCSAQQDRPGDSQSTGPKNNEKLLMEGFDLIAKRQADVAIKDYFDKVIESCKAQYLNGDQKYFASRSTKETLYYMVKASTEKQNAVAVAPTCADALYLKGYASIDLGQLDIGERFIRQAVEMSPVNAMYISELGHIYQTRRDWKNALDTFAQAEKYAQDFSPPAIVDKELSRAKRGVGYNLTELGRFDEAEAKYRECLKIDGNDETALRELEYIKSLRQKK